MAGSLAAPKMVGDEGKNFHYKFKRIPIYLILPDSVQQLYYKKTPLGKDQCLPFELVVSPELKVETPRQSNPIISSCRDENKGCLKHDLFLISVLFWQGLQVAVINVTKGYLAFQSTFIGMSSPERTWIHSKPCCQSDLHKKIFPKSQHQLEKQKK